MIDAHNSSGKLNVYALKENTDCFAHSVRDPVGIWPMRRRPNTNIAS